MLVGGGVKEEEGRAGVDRDFGIEASFQHCGLLLHSEDSAAYSRPESGYEVVVDCEEELVGPRRRDAIYWLSCL